MKKIMWVTNIVNDEQRGMSDRLVLLIWRHSEMDFFAQSEAKRIRIVFLTCSLFMNIVEGGNLAWIESNNWKSQNMCKIATAACCGRHRPATNSKGIQWRQLYFPRFLRAAHLEYLSFIYLNKPYFPTLKSRVPNWLTYEWQVPKREECNIPMTF